MFMCVFVNFGYGWALNWWLSLVFVVVVVLVFGMIVVIVMVVDTLVMVV